MTERYFDHAATTPMDPEVLEAMLPWLKDDFGNAHSLHHWGQKAEAAVAQARGHVARLFGAEDDSQIVFTSGATEANNWALSVFDRIAISSFEHSSVREPTLHHMSSILIPSTGWELREPTDKVDLISVMAVNNETGAILTPPAFPAPVHVDAVQALGKIKWTVGDVTLASASAHKLYGPKGVGALYVGPSLGIRPMILGGEQENGQRAGTLNVPGIVGFGEAARISLDRQERDFAHAEHLRNVVLQELFGLEDWQTNDAPQQSPFILSLSFYGIEGETLVIEADAAGFGISAGAACSSRSTEPSHVLTALGLPDEWRRGTIRISFGRSNTATSALELASFLRYTVVRLRSNR